MSFTENTQIFLHLYMTPVCEGLMCDICYGVWTNCLVTNNALILFKIIICFKSLLKNDFY